jgi:hypothetical protein
MTLFLGVTLAFVLVGVVPAAEKSSPMRELKRGDRYGELVLVRKRGFKIEAELWSTQGLNDCPETSWNVLKPKSIQAATGALAVVLNGPRYWLPDTASGTSESRDVRTFGNLDMKRITRIQIQPGRGNAPYKERVTPSAIALVFKKGSEIFLLKTPGGRVYVMQSMSQSVDPKLELADLPKLGARLKLPNGWSYQSGILNEDLRVGSLKENAVVIRDELGNAYQRR